MVDDNTPVPVARSAGRAAGRWWHRHGDTVKRTSRPVRKGWATLIAYGWFVGYMWVGLMLAVGIGNLTGERGPFTLVAAVGGGCAIGWWQAGYRLRRHADPTTPTLPFFGVALCAWLAVIGLGLLIDLR